MRELPYRQDAERTAVLWIAGRGLQELALVGAGLLIYYLIRGNVVNELSQAQAHALAVVHIEQMLGFYWEPALQRLLSAHLFQIQAWNLIYFWAHAPVIAVVGLWLYFRHREHYSLIRNAFMVSAVIGLCIYWLYPVAPPRLLSGYGFVDTMQIYSGLSYQAQSLRPFVNPYAAVPSLHFGWSFLIGVGLILGIGRRAGWFLGLLLPLLMFLAIVATANHFVLDALAGFGVCLVGLLAALAFRSWQRIRAARLAAIDAREPAPV